MALPLSDFICFYRIFFSYLTSGIALLIIQSISCFFDNKIPPPTFLLPPGELSYIDHYWHPFYHDYCINITNCFVAHALALIHCLEKLFLTVALIIAILS